MGQPMGVLRSRETTMGYTLIEEERLRAGGEDLFIFALHWQDQSTKRFQGLLSNNSGPSTCDMDSYYDGSLEWDGRQFVIDLDFA
ncbi:MAG TPA: hypothetical protein VEI52_16495 [Terriglobales bacterium]|nr:hypothetical protein [Terriglobales bacterium]